MPKCAAHLLDGEINLNRLISDFVGQSLDERGRFFSYKKLFVYNNMLISQSRVAMCQGKVSEFFFQCQGIVREFCKLSRKLGIVGKCQGIVREFCKLSRKLGIVGKCQGILKILDSSQIT